MRLAQAASICLLLSFAALSAFGQSNPVPFVNQPLGAAHPGIVVGPDAQFIIGVFPWPPWEWIALPDVDFLGRY